MKFTLMSDLHLEFTGQADIDTSNPEGADVLVLAGDITVADDLKNFARGSVIFNHEHKRGISATRYREFFDAVSASYNSVVYVAGNHEFYHGKFHESLDTLDQECTLNYDNVFFLENGYIDIKDVRFLGGTMWTNCNNLDAVTMQILQYSMNDYRTITNDAKGFTKLRPVHTVERHAETVKYIGEHIAPKTVVVTHHAPSFHSISPEYLRDPEMNGGYASNLEELILDNPSIAYWCHGHMHAPFDYPVGEYTRVVCNPRGYPGQLPDWGPKTFEV
jgi:predicted phosphodiesterase